MSYDAALDLVKRKRACVKPNSGFVRSVFFLRRLRLSLVISPYLLSYTHKMSTRMGTSMASDGLRQTRHAQSPNYPSLNSERGPYYHLQRALSFACSTYPGPALIVTSALLTSDRPFVLITARSLFSLSYKLCAVCNKRRIGKPQLFIVD